MLIRRRAAGALHLGGNFNKHFCLLFCFLISSCNQKADKNLNNHSEKPDLIVGGQSFDEHSLLPRNVVLLKTLYFNSSRNQNETSYCTGVLVYENIILTAAHCLSFESFIHAEIIFPISGVTETILQRQITIHPDYKLSDQNADFENISDLAVIKLKNDFPNPYLGISLLHANHESIFAPKVMGFGEQDGKLLSNRKKMLELKYVDMEITNISPKSAFFRISQSKGGICFGDSGGPAVVMINNQYYVLGIAIDILSNPSKIFEPGYDRCRQEALFLNIPHFADWIEQVVTSFHSAFEPLVGPKISK